MAYHYSLSSLVLTFLTLLSVVAALPTPIDFDTSRSSVNPGNNLLARNGTTAAFRNIWVNCHNAFVVNSAEEGFFCGTEREFFNGNGEKWLQANQCPSLCKCDCKLKMSCKSWNTCSAAKVKKICSTGGNTSFGCKCEEEGLLSPPVGETEALKGSKTDNVTVEHLVATIPFVVC